MKTILQKIKGFCLSIVANVRDLVGATLAVIAVLFITNLVASVGHSWGIDLDATRSFVFAIGKFAMVLLCGVGYMTHLTFRGSLGEFDIKEFSQVWFHEFTGVQRLEWFFRLCIAGMVSAALVFSIGV